MSDPSLRRRALRFKLRGTGMQLWIRRGYDKAGLGRGTSALLSMAALVMLVLGISVGANFSLGCGLIAAAAVALLAGLFQLWALLSGDDAAIAQQRRLAQEELSALEREEQASRAAPPDQDAPANGRRGYQPGRSAGSRPAGGGFTRCLSSCVGHSASSARSSCQP